jgi:hypothetical protein
MMTFRVGSLVVAGFGLGVLAAPCAVASKVVCESWSQPCQVSLAPTATVPTHAALQPRPKAIVHHSSIKSQRLRHGPQRSLR